MSYCGYECKCGNVIFINNSWVNYVCECPECNAEYLCNDGVIIPFQRETLAKIRNEDVEESIEYDDENATPEKVNQEIENNCSKYNTADIFDYIKSFNVHDKLLIVVQNNMVFKSYLQRNRAFDCNRSLFVAAENMIVVLESLSLYLSKYYVENIDDDTGKMENHLPVSDNVQENFNSLQKDLNNIIRYENLVKINVEFNLGPEFMLSDIHFWVRIINLAIEKIRSIQAAVK